VTETGKQHAQHKPGDSITEEVLIAATAVATALKAVAQAERKTNE